MVPNVLRWFCFSATWGGTTGLCLSIWNSICFQWFHCWFLLFSHYSCVRGKRVEWHLGGLDRRQIKLVLLWSSSWHAALFGQSTEAGWRCWQWDSLALGEQCSAHSKHKYHSCWGIQLICTSRGIRRQIQLNRGSNDLKSWHTFLASNPVNIVYRYEVSAEHWCSQSPFQINALVIYAFTSHRLCT